MKGSFICATQIGFLVTIFFLGVGMLTPRPVLALGEDREITGAFTGDITCSLGNKKAGFRDLKTQEVKYYTMSQVINEMTRLSIRLQTDSPEMAAMKQQQKTNLQRLQKLMVETTCPVTTTTVRTGPRKPRQPFKPMKPKPEDDSDVLIPSSNGRPAGSGKSSDYVLVPSSGTSRNNVKSSDDVLVPSSQ